MVLFFLIDTSGTLTRINILYILCPEVVYTNDEVVLELKEDVLTITKPSTPREGTIEYLFKDYSGGSFKTKLTNPLKPLGEEKW